MGDCRPRDGASGEELVTKGSAIPGEEPLTPQELVLFCILLLIAGNETNAGIGGSAHATVVALPDFDLESYWGRSRTDFEARLPAHFATLRVAPENLPRVAYERAEAVTRRNRWGVLLRTGGRFAGTEVRQLSRRDASR